jgi:Flp pilus assembly pilin Flp
MKGPEMTKHVRNRISSFFKDESAHAAAEYAILLAALVLVAMVAIGGIGGRVMTVYQAIETAVAGFA